MMATSAVWAETLEIDRHVEPFEVAYRCCEAPD
jgi:hypothetical protein